MQRHQLTIAALLLTTTLSYAQTPEPRELLARAEKRAENKHWLLVQIARTSERVDPDKSLTIARELFAKLKAANAGHTDFRTIAEIAAARDTTLRDDALREGIKTAQRDLADIKRWKAPPTTAPADPRTWFPPQTLLDQQKTILSTNVALWQAVIDKDARATLSKTLTDARTAGFHGTETRHPYLYTALRELATFDPDLAIIHGSKIQATGFAELTHQLAAERTRAGRRDRITETLITYAVANGAAHAESLTIYADFNLDGAWARAKSLKNLSALLAVIERFAWKDLDAALAAASAFPDPAIKRDLLDNVARVWAYKSPDTVEKPLIAFDKDARIAAIRTLATNEINARKAGRPPRDRIELAPRRGSPERFYPRPMAEDQRQRTRENLAKRPAANNAIENAATALVIDPTKLPEEKDANRLAILQAAAWRLYRTFGDTADITKMLEPLKASEADQVWSNLATQTARFADPAAAPPMAENIKSNDTYVYTICEIVRATLDTN